MIYTILFLYLAWSVAAFEWWRLTFVPSEVALNDKDITANGSADNLRKGYHSRRNWVRGLTLGALSAGAAFPLWWARSSGWAPSWQSWPAYGLGLLAVAVLLTGYFIRYFTPLLNLARRAAGRLDITEYYASSDSASWPDAKIWNQVRADTAASITSGPPDPQRYANELLQKLLTRTWLYCRAAAFLLACAAVLVAYNS
jgi:hypothetical protein